MDKVIQADGGQADTLFYKLTHACVYVFYRKGVSRQPGLNHGIREVKSLLAENGNPAPEFKVDYITAFAVEIPIAKDDDVPSNQVKDQVGQVIHQVVTKYSLSSDQVVSLLEALTTPMSALQIRTLCEKKDATYFRRTTLQPMLDDGLLQPTDVKSSRSPQQKYYLTEKGKQLYLQIKKKQ